MLSKEEIEKANRRFENGEETLDDLLNYYPNFRIQIEYYDGRQIELDVVEKKYYKKLVYISNKLNNMIDEMSKWIYEKDYNSQEIMLICERNRDYYSNNIEKIKQHFEKKVEEKNLF